MPTISIIVPVYNAEKYLHRCIDSILSQTYTDFELLLINDGSVDKSAKICDDYACKDDRIKIFYKENGGVSSARNIGIDNAKGKWVAFIDSDDWIKTDYLYSMISQSDADLVMSSFEIIDNVEKWDNSIANKLYSNLEIHSFLEHYIFSAALCSPWCKLFKRSIIDALRFNNDINYFEDTIFVYEYIFKINSIRVVENYGYQYRRGINESLSVKLLSIQEYRRIIQEFSKKIKILENRYKYDGTFARVAVNINQLRKCFHVIRDSRRPLLNRYKEFVELLEDENVQEILRYKNKQLKGKRNYIFDFMALNNMYLVLFVVVINFKGIIY